MADIAEKRKEALESSARTASENSSSINLPGDAVNIGIAMSTSAYTSGTFTAKIQHSLDGSVWEDLAGATTGAISATGLKTAFATASCLPIVRVVLTGATTPIATNQVFIIYG